MDNKLNLILQKSKRIAIFSHITPDADALCSAFALKNIINNNFDLKYVDVFIDGDIGEFYEPILRNEVVNPEPYPSYDLAFVLDCPNLRRIGQFEQMAEQIPTIINIDHHETNSKFGTLNYVSPKVSSTCELIYLIAKGQHLELDNLIAKELYQGIITDTNCFTSMSITPRTHSVVSELMKFKFDADKIKKYYFRNNSIAKTKLLTRALQSMKFYNNDQLTTMLIDYDTFSEADASFEDTLGIIDNGMNISRAQVSAILIESEPEFIHCSLRSKGIVNVGEIASIFNGGGSANLAAFQADGDIGELEKHLVSTIIERLPETTDDQEFIF